MNRIATGFLALHLPAFVLLAWLNRTGPLFAALATSTVLVGPLLAQKYLKQARWTSIVLGVAAIGMGAILVHLGQGPMQIEMHFYFFALIAMMTIFGNPMVIVAAASTVAAHHLAGWLLFPRSVFNYDAPMWVIAVHAGFIVLESTATCFVAREFFDRVLGLQQRVTARTVELRRRNQEMRLLLDNVSEGFVTIDRQGRIASESSAIFTSWFGPDIEGRSLFDLLEQRAPSFADDSRLAWEEVEVAVMPLALTLQQMPRYVPLGDAELMLEYRPIGEGEAPSRFLVVVSDVTRQREQERSERHRRETMKVFDSLANDRRGCRAFFASSGAMIAAIAEAPSAKADLAGYRRAVHTLKGNAALFGLESIAGLCHEIEGAMESGTAPPSALRQDLVARWSRLWSEFGAFIGDERSVIEIEEHEQMGLEAAIRALAPHGELLRMVHDWQLEPSHRRLDRFAEEARRIAHSLDKNVDVRVEANGLRVHPFTWEPLWNAFVHAVRNAVDHGIEPPDEREERGKRPEASIVLRTVRHAHAIALEVEDDGRGIDFARLRNGARAAGIEIDATDDPTRLLFHDGLSTALELTEFSGRGVGLGALWDAASDLGATIEIDTRIGAGTLLRVLVPEAASAPRDGDAQSSGARFKAVRTANFMEEAS